MYGIKYLKKYIVRLSGVKLTHFAVHMKIVLLAEGIKAKIIITIFPMKWRWMIISVYTIQIQKYKVFLSIYRKKIGNSTVDARFCLISCSELNSNWHLLPSQPISAREKALFTSNVYANTACYLSVNINIWKKDWRRRQSYGSDINYAVSYKHVRVIGACWPMKIKYNSKNSRIWRWLETVFWETYKQSARKPTSLLTDGPILHTCLSNNLSLIWYDGRGMAITIIMPMS